MDDKLKISFCTVSMNRLHHLRQTLPQNIIDNIGYGNVEFVILDYNSSDELQNWIKKEMYTHIESGVLKFYRTTEPKQFSRSHSRNMSFRLSSGDVICNIDADNFIGRGFAEFVNNVFQNQTNTYITPSYKVRDIIGKLSILRNDFFNIKGYNEEMDGYGFEDIELYKRLRKSQKMPFHFSHGAFTRAIYHSNEERLLNEHIGINCLYLFICYIDSVTTEIYFLYKNDSFEAVTLIDNQDQWIEVDLRGELDNYISLLNLKKTGKWKRNENHLCLWGENVKLKKYAFSEKGDYAYNRTNKIKLYEIVSGDFKNEIMLLKTEVENRLKTAVFAERPLHEINKSGFGKGRVKKNFKKFINLN